MDFIPPPMPAPGIAPPEDVKVEDSTLEVESSRSTSEMEQTDQEKVDEAGSQKQEGLEHFKKQDFKAAASSWSSGVTTLRGVTSTEGLALLQSLHLNLSLCYLKDQQWNECVKECQEVLKKDSLNAKALYRRAKANLEGLEDGEEAKDDLIQLIRKEPGNKEYRRMYEEALEKAKKQKEMRKANYTSLFSKPGLYDDREQAREKKLKEEEERKEREKKDFEDDMAKRAADGHDLVDFEEWKKEKKEKKEKEEAERRERQKDNKPASKQPSPVEGDGSDDYTEEEKKILRETKAKGYCYFKNSELTSEEREMKQKINRNAPTRIEDTAAESASSSAVPGASSSHASTFDLDKPWTPDMAGIGSGLSSWNSAGTSYEEKDMSNWAKECLRGLLLDVKEAPVASGTLSFTAVPQLDGEANAAVVRGTNRYFYDLDAKINFTYTPIDEGEEPSNGELLVQPTNVTASTDPDSPDWMSEGRTIWRTKNVDAEVSKQIHSKSLETVLCLIKGFEESFAKLIVK